MAEFLMWQYQFSFSFENKTGRIVRSSLDTILISANFCRAAWQIFLQGLPYSKVFINLKVLANHLPREIFIRYLIIFLPEIYLTNKLFMVCQVWDV